jgi:hypothetical protein
MDSSEDSAIQSGRKNVNYKLQKVLVLIATAISVVRALGEGLPPKSRSSLLAPLPRGVSELKFSDFFIDPVGPRGLMITEKLKSLNGKHVRIAGYMVREETRMPGYFLLTPLPVELNEEHYGFADDLPASTLLVFDSLRGKTQVPHEPGMILLSGILEVGPREEANGRISLVRLTTDGPGHEYKRINSAVVRGAEAVTRKGKEEGKINLKAKAGKNYEK